MKNQISRSVFRLLGLLAAGAFCLSAAAHASPEKAARFYEDALGRYERNDMAGAVIQLKNALQQDKRMLAAHLLLGKALLANGDLKGAEAAFEEALGQGVSRGEVAVPLARIYLALGHPEAVIERIPASGLPAALQVEVLTLRATAYFEAGNARLAARSLEEARALDPRSPVPLIAEVPMLLAGNQSERARAVAARTIELAPENAYAWNMQASVLHALLDVRGALDAYDRALKLEPRHVDARVARAALYVDLKREAEAGRDLDYLAGAAPGEPRAAYLRAVLASQTGDTAAIAAALGDVVKQVDALPPQWLVRREQLLMAGALAHHGLGNREKAREYLDMIVARNGGNIGARKLLATIYVETRDYSRALSQLEALQKVAPDDPQVLFLLGSVHMAQRRYLQASELLEKAAARTGSSEMNRALAFSQLGLGRIEVGQGSLEKAFAADPADTRAGTALAMLYMRKGDTQKAVATAEAMSRRDPANLTALDFLGSVKGRSGDRSGARAAYTQALTKDPAFRPAALNLARLDSGEGRFDDARRRLSEMLAKQRDDSVLLFELGLLEQRAGRGDEAIRHLRKANEVQRSDPRPGVALVDLHLARREIEQAQSVARELSSRYPGVLPVQLTLGRSFLAAGDSAGARSVLQGATRLAEYDAGMQVAIGHLQLAAGHPDGALYNAQKALQGLPDDPGALALLVEAETRRGDAAKADAALKTLRARHPERVETALTGAHLAMARGQYAAAVAAYRNALAKEKSTANALHLASAHLAAGEARQAALFLEEWTRSRPDDRAALKALAETQFRAGQLEAAKKSYGQALALEPDDAAMLNNYASLLLQLADPAARTHAERALQLAPNNAAYADTLGWILVQQQQLDAGLRYLREARLRNPESGEIRFHLAFALEKSGRTAEARDELRAALDGPGRVEGSAAVLRLKKALGL